MYYVFMHVMYGMYLYVVFICIHVCMNMYLWIYVCMYVWYWYGMYPCMYVCMVFIWHVSSDIWYCVCSVSIHICMGCIYVYIYGIYLSMNVCVSIYVCYMVWCMVYKYGIHVWIYVSVFTWCECMIVFTFYSLNPKKSKWTGIIADVHLFI